jgi:L-alanine-DL-glutamate epimerase-like enolase superfamily enzyme
MKIAAIDTFVLRIPYGTGGSAQAEAWGGRPWTTADSLLVRIQTDEGVTGWGEAFGYNVIPATRIAIDQILAPLYLGRDALDAAALQIEAQQKLHIFGRGGPLIYGMSGLDIALWDIAAKAAGQPLHRCLKQGAATNLPCYASLIRYAEPGIVAANVERATGLGYRHVKLHEIALPAIFAARKAAGEQVEIMLDVNCPWTLDEALHMAKRLQEMRPYWLEEPVWPPEDNEALSEVRAQGGVPIAAGENAATLTQFRQMLQAGAVDVLQPSPAKCGGVSQLVKIFALADAFGVRVVPHSFYDGPAFLAGLHVNAALGKDPLVEWRFFDIETPMLGAGLRPQGGRINVPQTPGLGIDPDPDVIARYRA